VSDFVTITGEVTYIAWKTPANATVLIGEVEAKLPVVNLSDNALDALAQQWIDHLYSGGDRKSPRLTFATTREGEACE
jgi:hypothetical protein